MIKKTTLGSGSAGAKDASKNVTKGTDYSEGKPETFAMGQSPKTSNPSRNHAHVDGKMGAHEWEHQSKSINLHNKISPARGY
jgi:hypothetical protein